MRLAVLKIGKVAYPEIRSLQGMYAERLAPLGGAVKFESLEAKDDAQAAKMLKRPLSEHPMIVLDERGKNLTSVEFAAAIRGLTDDPGVKSVTFVVGGPMGLPQELRRDARLTLSLSKATMTSDLAWLLLWEQIYRAYNILKGTGYHHD